jgi:protein TonB
LNNTNTLAPGTDNTLIWAITCSILLHFFLVLVLPRFEIEAPKIPEVLTVELVEKVQPEPVPEPAPIPEPEPQPEPEPVKPEPVKPKITPKAVVKPSPEPVEVNEEPAPMTPPSDIPEVIAVAPKPEALPTPNPVPPPVIPKPTTPSPAQISDANDQYGNTLWGAISKYKKYPRIAQQRGWQGEVVVELSLDGNGKLKSKQILQSSGYDSLDQQALEMVEKALPFPQPPEALRGSNFTIRVPIPFKLES